MASGFPRSALDDRLDVIEARQAGIAAALDSLASAVACFAAALRARAVMDEQLPGEHLAPVDEPRPH